MHLSEVPDIADVIRFGDDGRTDLLVEVPHGATATVDFARLATQIRSPLPPDLVDFFHVNTDVGAPELAERLAALAADEGLRVVVVRCRIPRTFIDCNRRIDASADDFRAGGVTPGLPPWITDPADRAMLLDRYRAYLAVVDAEVSRLADDGLTVLLHTYAPRTVDVEVDMDIVPNLRRAYEPDVVSSWPLRPELDVIGRDAEGVDHAPPPAVASLARACSARGWRLGASETYPMHPSALGWAHVVARPGRVLCVEVRRDLLADPFEPFAEMRVAPGAADDVAGVLADAVRAWRVQES